MTGGVGQIGHSLGRRGLSSVAVLAAGSLLAAVGLSACGVDVAKASTVIQDARSATLHLPDGTSSPAGNGTKVPKGATVSTAPGGSASLVTAGRVVLLGSDTAVRVQDGRREQLRQGLVMIDARRAGDLELDAGAATVSAARGSLTRVERDALLRVASFRKGASVRATGRRAHVAVDALHQVQVPYGGLPGRVTALGLTRDTWERRYALSLVSSDIDLTNLAAGLDSDPASTSAIGAVLPAAFGSAPAAGERRSEETLAFLVARAARGDKDTFRDVRRFRAEGGSWGVVAAIVGAQVGQVSAALDALLAPDEPVLAAEPGSGQVDVGGLLGGGGRPDGDSGGSPTGGASPRPTTGPAPSRSPGPRPSASPNPVEEVVRTVQSLLPSPPPLELLPSPSASPLLQVGVGGITLGIG